MLADTRPYSSVALKVLSTHTLLTYRIRGGGGERLLKEDNEEKGTTPLLLLLLLPWLGPMTGRDT